jgi:hypothetical protein
MTNAAIIALRDEDLQLASGGAATQDQIIWDEQMAGGLPNLNALPPRKGPSTGTVQTINFPERAPAPKAPKKAPKK